MADRFSRIDAPRSAPEMGATPRQARWSWVIIAAIVVALGLPPPLVGAEPVLRGSAEISALS